MRTFASLEIDYPSFQDGRIHCKSLAMNGLNNNISFDPGSWILF